MAVENTLSIIKPDAVSKNVIGQILARFEAKDLTLKAVKMMQLTEQQAGEFMKFIKNDHFLLIWFLI